MGMTTTLNKFTQVYADAVVDSPHVGLRSLESEAAYRTRELNWRGSRMPLNEAAKLYETIVYEEFQPDMLTKLNDAFPDGGIEATPARVYSVCVFLHIPNKILDAVTAWIKKNWHANEIGLEDDGSLRVWWD